MVASVRYSSITNTTGAAVVAGGATITSGQDYASEVVTRVLAAADVGNAAGQTQNAAGMIFAEFKGANIKQVVSAVVLRTAGGFAYEFLGTDAVSANFGFQIVNAGGVSTLRLKDLPTNLAAFLAAGDQVVVTLALGNVNS